MKNPLTWLGGRENEGLVIDRGQVRRSAIGPVGASGRDFLCRAIVVTAAVVIPAIVITTAIIAAGLRNHNLAAVGSGLGADQGGDNAEKLVQSHLDVGKIVHDDIKFDFADSVIQFIQ